MKKLLITIAFVFLSLFLFSKQASAEVIRDFQTQATIQKNGTVDIVEYIHYDFLDTYRHGIFRYIPYIKENKEGKKFIVRIDIKKVVDENNTAYKWKKSQDVSKKEVTIKIGDPDRKVSGAHKYFIHYRVSGGLTYFSDHDEFYWNVTGNGWTVPIEKTLTKITLPQVVDEINLKRACYTGVFGGTEANCTVSTQGQEIFFETTKPLFSGEGLTIALGFPKGMVAVLEPKEYVSFWETRYGKLLSAFIIIFFGGLALFWYIVYPFWIILKWYRYGRDPSTGSGEVRAWFDPPQTKDGRSLTPGETGALTDEVVHMRDISATIVDLARRGYLVIEEKKKKDFYLHKKKEYVGDTSLVPFERELLSSLFSGKNSLRVKDAKLAIAIQKVKNSLYDELVTNGLFPKSPESVRGFYMAIGAFALFTFNIPLALIAFMFGWHMPRKTLEGAQAAQIAKSVKNFLSSQERQLKFQANKQLMFEKLLPYAVAFGVEKIWAERFKNINLKAPEWYSTYDRGSFNSVHFTNSLNSSFRSVASAATPTSSSSGFSSGFSGGSSGGGGGGGGGGSW